MLNINKEVWEETEVKEYGDYEPLKLGGHACIIRNADKYTGKSGNESLRVQVDIDTTDKQAGFFQKQFDNDTRSEKKWSNGATKYFSLKEENLRMLKAFTTAVENSNAGFKFDMDETKLKGKKIAGVFGWEEYEKQDGTIGVATKLTQIRSLDKLNEIRIPKVKKLDGSFVDYEEYKNHRATATAEEVFGSSIVETDSGDLPFEI
jgi:hypothetical protein